MQISLSDFLTPQVIQVDEFDKCHSKVVLNLLSVALAIHWVMHCVGFCCHQCRSCAVEEVEIDGVVHEYSTIEGVREDVIEILLNLKGWQLY